MVNQSIEQLLQEAIDQSMAQTQESRELAEEVATTIGDIRKEASDAVDRVDAAIPDAVKREMSKTFYVNVATGNDENDGVNVSRPFATLDKAITESQVGGSVTIYLESGETVTLNNSHNISNKTILVRARGADSRPLLINKALPGNYTTGLIGTNCSFSLFNVDAESVGKYEVGGVQSSGAGLFGAGAKCQMDVNIYASDIAIGDTPLFGQYAGQMYTVSIYASLISDNTIEEPCRLFANRGDSTLIFQCGATTLPEGKQWADMFASVVRAADGEPRNIVSNLAI